MTHTKFHFKQGKTNKHKVTPSPSPFSGSVLLESEADDRSAVCAEVVSPRSPELFSFLFLEGKGNYVIQWPEAYVDLEYGECYSVSYIPKLRQTYRFPSL